MISSQYFSCALADNDTGSHGVAGRHARHDGSVGNTQAFDSIDFEVAINYRHGIASHLGGIRLMPVGNDRIPDEVCQCSPFQVTRHHLALGERTKCGGVAYLAAELHTSYRCL